MNPAAKPFSQASENNKDPILAVLEQQLQCTGNLLEIGSGTGQHACYFSARLPQLFWQASDRASSHAGINLWIDELETINIGRPLLLDVGHAAHWEAILARFSSFDAVFTANTAHIMSWEMVVKMFAGASRVLIPAGLFIVYGPFNHNGEFTSEGNYRFDMQLKGDDPQMGIRDDRDVIALGKQYALEHTETFEMPANNQVLIFRNAPK